jgi:ubiquinone/menaquinone biosynthesis C-methylase UbiE
MANLAGSGAVLGVDQSPERLDLARALARDANVNIRFLQGPADALPLDDGVSDYTHARMLFQYLGPQKRSRTLQEMRRVTRPGGKVVVVDLDQQLTRLYPMPAGVRTDLTYALRILRQRTGFDPNVGRKLVSEMRHAGLRKVTAIVEPYQRYAGGALPDRDRENWEEKLTTAASYLVRVTGETSRWTQFRDAYLAALQADDAFYCADMVITTGECP